jgi:PAS domain S-box-containing protein
MQLVVIGLGVAAGGLALVALTRLRRVNRQLALAVATHEDVIASASDAIIACGPDGVTVTMWNSAAERIFGYDAVDVLGRPLPTVPGEPGRLEREAIMARVKAGERVQLVTERTRADGTLVDVRINYSGLTDERGGFAGWMGVVQDVTAELAEARTRAERAALVERLAKVTADLTADLDRDVILSRLIQYAAEVLDAAAAGFIVLEPEAFCAAVHRLPTDLVGFRFPPERGLFREAVRTRRRLQVPDLHAYQNRVEEVTRAAPGLHTMVVTPVVVRDQPAGVITLFFPDVDHKISANEDDVLDLLAGHAAAALATATAYEEVVRGRGHEQAVIDSVADGIAVVAPGGTVVGWNRAAERLTGVPSTSVLGRALPFNAGSDAEPAETELATGRWVEVVSSPLGDGDERVVILRDVSHQKALERAKSAFLASTSHELKTPLTVIKGFARLLLDRGDDVPEEEKALALSAIAARSEELIRLVEKVLLSARTEARLSERPSEPVDLAAVVRSTADSFAGSSPEHEVVVDVPTSLPPVRADLEDVDTALGQLLENAIKYSPDGGKVEVRATAIADEVIVTVRDEGVGLTAEDTLNVFEPFYQGTTRRTHGIRGGVGLGLAIVRRLVETHGGRVWAEGSPGEGSTFGIALPVAHRPFGLFSGVGVEPS